MLINTEGCTIPHKNKKLQGAWNQNIRGAFSILRGVGSGFEKLGFVCAE
jgi:hypothetical protein